MSVLVTATAIGVATRPREPPLPWACSRRARSATICCGGVSTTGSGGPSWTGNRSRTEPSCSGSTSRTIPSAALR